MKRIVAVIIDSYRVTVTIDNYRVTLLIVVGQQEVCMEGINKCKREMARDKHNDRYSLRKIRLIESKAKCRYLKKFTCKGTLQ
jgi:hypothetical protein